MAKRRTQSSLEETRLAERLRRVASEIGAAGAVVVVGAGASRAAGMPLVAELPPLLWLALDASEDARRDVAEQLGSEDGPAKSVVGSDEPAMRAAFQALRRHPKARLAFQHAFAERDRAAAFQYPAHDALARLFHRGVAEMIVSYNWDTVVERCHAARYGRRLMPDEHFWKPHGDAALPNADWVLPGDPGRVPDELVDKASKLAHERPRVLVMVGYSERDQRVVDLLTGPLRERWVVCRISPSVTDELDLPVPAEQALPALAATLVPALEVPGWDYVTFGGERDLGAALEGRALGAADALACPSLVEVEQVVRQLKTSFSARVAGKPGSGKSITAYQAAKRLLDGGFEVVRLADLSEQAPELALRGLRFPTLAVVDDAHLLPSSAVKRLEEGARNSLRVLCVSALDYEEHYPGTDTVLIDSRRAVKTIADSLRRDPARTLEAVAAADSQVGRGYMDLRLEDRLEEAERADYPWQFCFILSGGWRRASDCARVARAAGADLVLAAAAIHQLAWLDTPGEPERVFRIAQAGGSSAHEFASASARLVRQRLLISEQDLRCPHRRFAAVVLDRVYAVLPDSDRESWLEMCRRVIGDASVPLAGISILLHELFFGDNLRLAREEILGKELRDALVSRALASVAPTDRMYACLILQRLEGFVEDWPRSIVEPAVGTLVEWLKTPEHPVGHGMAHLVNNMWNTDKEFARRFSAACSPEPLGRAICSASPETVWSLAALVDRLRLGADDRWVDRFVGGLDRAGLQSSLERWPQNRLWALSELITALSGFDRELGMTLVGAASALIQQRFADSPVEAFQEVDDLLWKTLYVWDPLDLFGSERTTEQVRAARLLFSQIDPDAFARQVATSDLRSLEVYSCLLYVMRVTSPALLRRIIRAVDGQGLSTELAPDWKEPGHELTRFVCQLRVDDACEPAKSWIQSRSGDISTMPVRFAYISPEAACEVLRRGGTVALSDAMTFEWELAASVVDKVLERDAGLATPLLSPHLQAAAEAFGRNQANTFSGVDAFLAVLLKRAPETVGEILALTDPPTAEIAWVSCLRGKQSERRAAAALVQASTEHGGALGEVGARLRERFPRSSIPAI